MLYFFVYILGVVTVPVMFVSYIVVGIKDHKLFAKRLSMLKDKLPSIINEIKNEI